jgi:hypothetical protein
MEKEAAQGIRLGGAEPKALLLGDGTRLTLEDEAGSAGRSDWTLVRDDRDGGDGGDGVSVAEALKIAGDEHADYVRTRTRAEVAWLRVVSEWFSDQAERLDRELAGSRA